MGPDNHRLVKERWCWWDREYAPDGTVLEGLETEAREAAGTSKSSQGLSPIVLALSVTYDQRMILNDVLEKNNMLQGLPLSERQLINTFCKIMELHLGDSTEQAGHPIEFLHFPIDSAISLINVQDQERIVEVTVTGREGCVE